MERRPRTAPSWTLPALAALVVLAAVAFLQLTPPYLYGVDSYFHARVPHFLFENGPDYEFHWARFTTLAERWSDKEFLFHALMTPLSLLGDDILPQARIAAIVYASLLLVCFVAALRRDDVRPSFAALATLALPLSITFLVYLNVLRPKTLAVALVLLLVRFLVDGRWVGVLAVAVVYPLAHISFPAVAALTIAIELARLLYGRRLLFQNVLAAAGGTFIGVFAHPNFPDNVYSLYLNGVLVPWSAAAGGIRLGYGMEWNPITTKALVLGNTALFVGLFLAAALTISGRVKPSFPTVGWFAAMLLFGFPAMFSFTYWYYACPVTLVFLAHLFSDGLAGRGRTALLASLVTGGAVLAGAALLLARGGAIETEFAALGERNLHYQRVARWMRQHLPPGEIVFHASWSDSPYFIGLNPANDYLVVLDPIYMHQHDPELYARWVNLARGFGASPASEIRERFGARFGYTGADRGLYRRVLDRPDEFTVLYREPRGLVFGVPGPKPDDDAPADGPADGPADVADDAESPIMDGTRPNPTEGGTP